MDLAGVCCYKYQKETNNVIRNGIFTDLEIPIFTENRNYIEQYI